MTHGSTARPQQDTLHHLRKEWALMALFGALFLAACFGLLIRSESRSFGFLWLVTALILLVYQFASLWMHLDENRPKEPEGAPLFGDLGPANRITIVRGVFIAGFAGFVWGTRPHGWLAWAPGVLFLADVLLDYLDGYLARITRRTTGLGERLDMQWDSAGVLLACILAVRYGQAPLPYLLVGLARYQYLLGLWLYRRRGGSVADLPLSRYRRPIAGMQMGFLAVALLPVFGPPATQIAAVFFMLPLLGSFLSDYLSVTGRRVSGAIAAGSRVGDLLPLALRAGLAVLLAMLAASRAAQGSASSAELLAAGLVTLALILGISGRLVALGVLLMAGFALQSAPFDGIYWAIFVGSLLLFMTGTGRFSLWKPEEWVIDHRAGETRS